MMMAASERRTLTVNRTFEMRESDGEKHICGYFAVFNSAYELWCSTTTRGVEMIDRHAFDDQMEEDVRALINHDTTMVLGRTTTGTLKLSLDDTGLYGDILINPDDQDALNLYARVKRGDVSQCSFGFDVRDEVYARDDNTDTSIWTINSVKLYEVSVCTFPAYQDTEVEARMADARVTHKRQLEQWKKRMKERLNRNGT